MFTYVSNVQDDFVEVIVVVPMCFSDLPKDCEGTCRQCHEGFNGASD